MCFKTTHLQLQSCLAGRANVNSHRCYWSLHFNQLCTKTSTRKYMCRDHLVYAPSQWETTLQCNVVSHWLGAYTKWSLYVIHTVHDWSCEWCHGWGVDVWGVNSDAVFTFHHTKVGMKAATRTLDADIEVCAGDTMYQSVIKVLIGWHGFEDHIIEEACVCTRVIVKNMEYENLSWNWNWCA